MREKSFRFGRRKLLLMSCEPVLIFQEMVSPRCGLWRRKPHPTSHRCNHHMEDSSLGEVVKFNNIVMNLLYVDGCISR